jgi:hypothetical protein
LPKAFAHDPARREQFANEVRLACRVTDPHVCRTFYFFEDDGRRRKDFDQDELTAKSDAETVTERGPPST